MSRTMTVEKITREANGSAAYDGANNGELVAMLSTDDRYALETGNVLTLSSLRALYSPLGVYVGESGVCSACAIETLETGDPSDALSVMLGYPIDYFGESDSPTACDTCGAWIGHALTRDGYAYVVESAAYALAQGRRDVAPFADMSDVYCVDAIDASAFRAPESVETLGAMLDSALAAMRRHIVDNDGRRASADAYLATGVLMSWLDRYDTMPSLSVVDEWLDDMRDMVTTRRLPLVVAIGAASDRIHAARRDVARSRLVAMKATDDMGTLDYGAAWRRDYLIESQANVTRARSRLYMEWRELVDVLAASR